MKSKTSHFHDLFLKKWEYEKESYSPTLIESYLASINEFSHAIPNLTYLNLPSEIHYATLFHLLPKRRMNVPPFVEKYKEPQIDIDFVNAIMYFEGIEEIEAKKYIDIFPQSDKLAIITKYKREK